ncbi:MAG: CPBP family intramembrane metalloprotease [Clostridiales bacterium]|nr:CPBP family intramembrane metalloprotease [Clostridiales bacterium]
MKNKKTIIELIIAIIGTFLLQFGLICFNKYALMSFPLTARRVLIIVMYWIVALIPVLFCIKNNEKLDELGFSKEKILKQILIGIAVGCIMSIFITLIPILIFGKENTYSSSNYKYIWQYIYQFVYLMASVALTEEFIFRGYLLNKFKKISKNTIIPILTTSLLFGLFHIFNGNIIQVMVTTFIGLILVICKEKIKNCSLLSLIIAHGIYDWFIVLITAIL